MIELRTLGHVDLTTGDDGNGEALLTQPKRFALFCYLALPAPGTMHRRDTLLGVFWPEHDQQRARADLRQALSFLRRTLGQDALRKRGTDEIGIDAERVWCDVAAFEQAVERHDWARAVELYRGDFLAGFFISGEPEFEQWLDARRTRLRAACGTALRGLATAATAAGDAEAAAAWCRKLVEHEPYSTREVLRCMEAMQAAGDRAGALEQAERHAARLRDDLDAAPSPDVMAYAERLRLEPEARAVPDRNERAPAAPVEQLERLPSAEGTLPLPEPSAAPSGGGTVKKTVPADGVRKGRWMITGVAVAVAVIIALTAALAALRGGDVTLDRERVVVAVFRNETGDPSLDPLGKRASHAITQGIRGAGDFVRFTPWDVALQSFRYVQREADAGRVRDVVRALAEETGSGTIISGAYYLESDSIRFQIDVTDATTGNLLGSPEPVVGSHEAPSELLERLQQRVMGFLAMRLDERYATPAGHIGHLPTYEAYQTFDEGMELLLEDYNSQDALRQFLRAFELDSTFYTALIYAAIPVVNRGGRHLMDSILHVLTSNADRLSEYDRHWVRVFQAVIDADHEAALRAARSAARLAPQSRAAYLHAYLLELLNRPREELEVLAAIDPERGGMKGNWLYWIRVIVAHHMLGEYVQELDAARRAREQYPDLTFFRGYEVGALAALDRLDDVRQVLVEAEDQARSYYVAPALRAHGHIGLAREVCGQWVEWLRALPPEEAAQQGNRFALAFALYYADEWAEALPIAEELVAELAEAQPGDVRTFTVTNYVGLLGLIRARLGDRDGALDISERLAAMDTDEFLDLDTRTAWRAQIAALVGEHAEAVRLLQEKARQGWVYPMWLHHYAAFEPLRDYPPFQEFMKPNG